MVAEKRMSGPGLINAGCYILSTDLLKTMNAGKNFSFEVDFLMQYLPKLHFDVFITQGLFIDIGVPDDYQKAQKKLSYYAAKL